MQNFESIRRLDTSFDANDDVEATRPQLRRTKTIVPSAWDDEEKDQTVKATEGVKPHLRRTSSQTTTFSKWTDDEHEKALYDDFVGENASHTTENGDEDETEKVENPNVLRNSNEVFQHLQQGVCGIFYQNEHHTKHLYSKLEEMEKSITASLDIINTMNARMKILEDELSKCKKKSMLGLVLL